MNINSNYNYPELVTCKLYPCFTSSQKSWIIGLAVKIDRDGGRQSLRRLSPFIQYYTTNTKTNTSKPRLRGRLPRVEYYVRIKRRVWWVGDVFWAVRARCSSLRAVVSYLSWGARLPAGPHSELLESQIWNSLVMSPHSISIVFSTVQS